MPTRHDSNKYRIHILCNNIDKENLFKQHFKWLRKQVRGKIERPPSDHSGISTPEESSKFFHDCRQLIEEELQQQARYFSPVQWLWYLRRLPNWVFEGQLTTTAPYDSVLATIASSYSTDTGKRNSNLMQEKGFITYPINKRIIKRVLEFCNLVRTLSNYHVGIRLASKNVSFVLKSDGTFDEQIDPEKEESIRLYDSRVENKSGLSLADAVGTTDLHKNTSSNLLVLAPINQTILPIPDQNFSVEANFTFTFIELEDIFELNNKLKKYRVILFEKEVGALLILFNMYFDIIREKLPLHTFFQYGYFLWKKTKFEKFVNYYFDLILDHTLERFDISPDELPESATELWEILKTLEGNIWPMQAGSILRQEDNTYYIDFYSATIRLRQLLEYPSRTGKIANLRADHFELATQSIIEQTKWNPSDTLMSTRGRTLRYNGESITDIDAIGEFGENLLIVSCKSIVYTFDYDSGDYKSIRNTTTKILKAVEYWQGIKSKLLRNPIGDNYDFSKYKNIIAIVCTPRIFYVPIGQATQYEEENLRKYSSIEELKKWLES